MTNQPKQILVSTLPPYPGLSYITYDAIVAVNDPYADVYKAFEQLRWHARQLDADAVVGVQISISTFYGGTTFTKKERVVVIGTPIKYLSPP